MTDAELPDIDAAADAAVDRLFADRGSMAHRWILVADVTLDSGERAQYVLASPGSQVIDALGLLNFGLQVQAEKYEE